MSSRNPEATSLAEKILKIYSALIGLESLIPGERVNSLFMELVQLTSYFDPTLATEVLNHKKIQQIAHSLRLLSSQGEYELEKYWAIRLATSQNSYQALKQFPYYKNYQDLIRLEYSVLSGVSTGLFHKVLFIGSGPLPLTPVLLATEYGLAVDALDKSEEAVILSEKVLINLKMAPVSQVLHTDILSMPHPDIQAYDLIYVAALVGVSKGEKETIFKHLFHRMSTGAFLVIRTANGLRTLLYPQVPLDILARFNLKVIVHPLNDLINSFIITQKV